MKRFTSMLALCGLVFSANAQQDLLNEMFTDEVMPTKFTLVNLDGMGFQKRAIGSEKLLYYSITPEKTWFVGAIDNGDSTENSSALSASRRDNAEKSTNNWLITPSLAITEDCFLRWDARSVHADFPEDYDVMISTTDAKPESFELLQSYKKETYAWNVHTIDLSKYAGQKVYIAFVHNSTNQYILAIDNLRVGPLTDRKLVATNFSKHFVADVSSTPIDIRIHNYGRDMKVNKVVVIVDDKEVASSEITDFTIPRTHYIDLTIPLEVKKGEQYSYTVKAMLDNGGSMTLLNDAVWCYDSPRKLVAEKFTGTWCNACARLTPLCKRIETHFKDEAIVIEPHFDFMGRDDITNASYGGELGSPLAFSSYPSMFYNRNLSQKQNEMKVKDLTPMTNALAVAVKGEVAMQAVDFGQPGMARLVSFVKFNEDIDNTDGKVKLGYAVFAKDVISQAKQLNGATMLGVNYSEFSILPGEIPADAIVHHNVPVGENAPVGVEKSLPEKIEAGKIYTHTHIIEFPDNLPIENLEFVTFLLDDAAANNIVNADIVSGLAKTQANAIVTLPSRMQQGTEAKARVYSPELSEAAEWISSDESVATVKDGVVKAIAPGEAVITLKNGDTECTSPITVYDNAPVAIVEAADENDPSSVENVSANADSIKIGVYGSTVIVNPGNATDYSVKVYGVDGTIYTSTRGNADTAILPLSELPSGVYIIRVDSSIGTKVAKIILR